MGEISASGSVMYGGLQDRFGGTEDDAYVEVAGDEHQLYNHKMLGLMMT